MTPARYKEHLHAIVDALRAGDEAAALACFWEAAAKMTDEQADALMALATRVADAE